MFQVRNITEAKSIGQKDDDKQNVYTVPEHFPHEVINNYKEWIGPHSRGDWQKHCSVNQLGGGEDHTAPGPAKNAQPEASHENTADRCRRKNMQPKRAWPGSLKSQGYNR